MPREEAALREHVGEVEDVAEMPIRTIAAHIESSWNVFLEISST